MATNSLCGAGWRVCIAIGALIVAIACSGNASLMKPPLQVPFAAERNGSKVEVDLVVSEYRSYEFRLRFPYKEDGETDFLRVRKLTGSSEKTRVGKLVDPGVPLRIRLEVAGRDSSNARLHYEKISEPTLASYGGGYVTKIIDSVNLKPGHYLVSAESLLDASEFNGAGIQFGVGWYWNSSVISE